MKLNPTGNIGSKKNPKIAIIAHVRGKLGAILGDVDLSPLKKTGSPTANVTKDPMQIVIRAFLY